MAHIANASGTAGRVAATLIVSFIAVAAAADPPQADPQNSIDSTTVAAPRDRAAVERQVRTFVNAIAIKPGDESLARWQTQIPLCPLVAGMPSKDGEYILSRVSKIAASFGQVAAYVSMIGLVQLRPQANVTDVPTILNLFTDTAKAPPGLTAWDESFLKAVYQTRITDRTQLAAIKTAMVQDVAP